MSKCRAPVAITFVATSLLSKTPKRNIKTKHGRPLEEERKQQMDGLAKQGDLSKYSITRDMLIERGAMNHSSPLLKLNLRFLNDNDLALSGYVPDQGHWVLTERHRSRDRALFGNLQQAFPKLDKEKPEGDSEVRSSYFHIAVCVLEWQTREELVGREARAK